MDMIDGFILWAHVEHIEIKLSPKFYYKEVLNTLKAYKEMKWESFLDSSWGAFFKGIIVREGDWGNGEPKVETARKWFGEQFETFKENFPDKYAKLIEMDQATQEKNKAVAPK